jgi:hypothetical protein
VVVSAWPRTSHTCALAPNVALLCPAAATVDPEALLQAHAEARAQPLAALFLAAELDAPERTEEVEPEEDVDGGDDEPPPSRTVTVPATHHAGELRCGARASPRAAPYAYA